MDGLVYGLATIAIDRLDPAQQKEHAEILDGIYGMGLDGFRKFKAILSELYDSKRGDPMCAALCASCNCFAYQLISYDIIVAQHGSDGPFHADTLWDALEVVDRYKDDYTGA